jgi:hypothetical protein
MKIINQQKSLTATAYDLCRSIAAGIQHIRNGKPTQHRDHVH